MLLYAVAVEGFGGIGVALLRRLPIVEPRRVALVLRPRHCLGIAAFGTRGSAGTRRDSRACFGFRNTRGELPAERDWSKRGKTRRSLRRVGLRARVPVDACGEGSCKNL